MTGTLHVLSRPDPESPRLHTQAVDFTDPPKRGVRFLCRARGFPPFLTGRVELEPQRFGAHAVWFKTAHTAYLLELGEGA